MFGIRIGELGSGCLDRRIKIGDSELGSESLDRRVRNGGLGSED